MPDETIALGPWGRGQGTPGGGGLFGNQSPFAMMGDVMRLRQTQQEWNARSAYGEHMAAHPDDPEAGLRDAYADPLVSGWMPQLLTEGRQQALLGYQIGGQKMKNASDGMEALMQAVVQAGNDPAALMPALQARFGTLPVQVQKDLLPMAQQFAKGMIGDLHGTPEEQSAQYQQNRAQWMIANKASPANAYAATGLPTPGISDVGGVPTPTLQYPPFGPHAGQLTIPGQQPTPSLQIPAPGGGGGGSPAPGPSSAPPPAGQQRTQAAGPGAVGGDTPITTAQPQPAQPRMAGNGQPLVLPSDATVPGVVGTGLGGAPVLSSGTQETNKKYIDYYDGERGMGQYHAAQNMLGSLDNMEADLDQMNTGGSAWLKSGPGAAARGRLAALVNTVYGISGEDPKFDPKSVAAIEDFNKESQRAAFQFTNQMLGGQKEAAEVIKRGSQSVPGVENTYLGGKIIIDQLRALSQRTIDERDFIEMWREQHNGVLAGAPEAFNKAFPIQSYFDPINKKYGIGTGGKFESPEAIRHLRDEHLLSDKEASDYVYKQFGNQFKAKGQQ